MQDITYIDDVRVPIIKEEGEIWYPFNFVLQKVINISTNANNLVNDEVLGKLMKKLTMDYGCGTGGIQEVYCITEEGLKLYLTKHLKVGKYSAEKRKRINILLKYLKLELLSEDEQLVKKYDYSGKYNVFIEDCINEVLKENPKIKWQKCSECNNYYPLCDNFFRKNNNQGSEFNVKCRDCQNWTDIKSKIHIKHPNKWLNKIYYDYGEDKFIVCKNHDVIEIYKLYISSNKKHIPKIINNKKDALTIIKWLFESKKINKINISYDLIIHTYKIPLYSLKISMDEIYILLFNSDWKEYPWKYPNAKLLNLTIEEAKIIFNNYLKINNIKINDIFTFNYTDILRKAKLSCYLNNYMDFIIKYYNYEYPAYKFKNSGVNYYKEKENRIRDLKYFIEKDMKIDINKIPLYLTKMTLIRNARTLYNLLCEGEYYKNLFEWVEECYPNKFIEADFVINPYRDEYDSMEEADLDKLLHKNFKSVIYNQRNTERTIKIDNMIPDWIIFTDTSCILVEYFGLWLDRDNKENLPKRNLDYMNKTVKKIEKYKELNGYKFIDLYPRDLEKNYEGVKNKIQNYLES